jgi:hypothetical protein
MTSYRGVGLLVAFEDDEQGNRFSTGQGDRKGLSWSHTGGGSPEPGQVVAIGPPCDGERRVVVHPVPKTSRVWGAHNLGVPLVLHYEGREIGRAVVVWTHNMDQGLQPSELRDLVRWTSSGGPSPFAA